MPLLLLILDLCRLRRGPQDLPYSPGLLGGTVAATVLLRLVLAAFTGNPIGNALIDSVISLGFVFLSMHIMLTLRGLRTRFVQATTALLLCSLFFDILLTPLVLMAGPPPLPGTAPQDVPPQYLLVGLIALPLMIWNLVTYAHVLRHSLDVPFVAGLAIALAWLGLLLVLSRLAGAPLA
ncbi:MAG TPA: hypothetical protein VF132_10620 [Rudaea sp.]